MHTVSLKDKEDLKKFEVEDKCIVFDALEDQGEILPHGCLAGSCGACRIEILEGAENLTPISEVETNTIEALLINYKRIHGDDRYNKKDIRLACRAKVKGDITISPLD